MTSDIPIMSSLNGPSSTQQVLDSNTKKMLLNAIITGLITGFSIVAANPAVLQAELSPAVIIAAILAGGISFLKDFQTEEQTGTIKLLMLF